MTPLWLRTAACWRRFRRDSVIHEITPRCNLACRHCYNIWKNEDSGPTGSGGELPPDRLAHLVERALAMSRCRHYTFTGGEPTLREDLEDLVRLTRRHCRSVTLITNGTLLPEARVKSLLAAGTTLVELPLNGGEAVTHDAAVGYTGAFAKVTRAAAEVRYHGGQVAFVFVATRQNIAAWPQALETGLALGGRAFLFNRYNAGGACRQTPADLMPDPGHLRQALAVAETHARDYGVAISASIAMPPCLIDHRAYPHVGFGFCAAGTDRSYETIDPLGNLRPCNHTATVLGNLFAQPMHALLRSPALAAFRAARPAFCDPCPLADRCQGGCKAAAEACSGDLCACEPFLALNLDAARAGMPR